MAKPTAGRKRETGSVYSCVCICTLHGVAACRQQTMEIRGHHQIYLAFLPFSAILLSLFPANHKFLSQNGTADTPVVKHGCWITACSNYWNALKRDMEKDTMVSEGLCNRPDSGKLRVLSCACIFFSFQTISLDLYSFFGLVKGEISKEFFQLIFCLLSSPKKGCFHKVPPSTSFFFHYRMNWW